MSASSVVSATISTQQTHYSITTSGLEMNDTGTFIAVWYSVIPLTGRDGSTTTNESIDCLLYTSPSPRDMRRSRMPSSA